MKGIEFTIIRNAYIWNDLSWNLGMHTIAGKSNPEPKGKFIRSIILSFLVKHPDVGYFLFDTGLSPIDAQTRTEYQKEYFPIEVEDDLYIDKQLEKLGLSVHDISCVIASHLHWDHIDGIELFQGTKAIKNIYTSHAELQSGLMYTHGAGPKDPGDPIYCKRVLDNPEIEYKFVNEDTEIFPGVHLFTMTGHTPGGLAMMLEMESGNYIFPGDSIFRHEQFQVPPIPAGLVLDTLGFNRSVEKLYKIQQANNATMIYSHDPIEFENYKKAPEFYK